ncbi:MAG: metallophosphoesterase [Actinomycetota bacterium]|nr:metallophosphoesterase [Actinomycetota bacterium]
MKDRLASSNVRRQRSLGRLAAASLLLLVAFGPSRPRSQDETSSLGSRSGSAGAGLRAPRSDPVVAAAGDIACDPGSSEFLEAGPAACGMQRTADVLGMLAPDAILTLGDNQYVCGAYRAFEASFDATWGRFGSLLHPTPGDHDYMTTTSGGSNCSSTPTAPGYYRYFGSRAVSSSGRSWYSFDLLTTSGTTWHIVSLNSNCLQVPGGCARDSPQETWLRRNLATHPTDCTLAYWYNPRFSSGKHGNDVEVAPFWGDLYRAGVDVVLNGHSHDYERFSPQTPGADPSALGLSEFVVGTGGIGLESKVKLQANSQVFSASSLGVLRLQLGAGSYSWRFIHVAGGTFTDSGTALCHGPPTMG